MSILIHPHPTQDNLGYILIRYTNEEHNHHPIYHEIYARYNANHTLSIISWHHNNNNGDNTDTIYPHQVHSHTTIHALIQDILQQCPYPHWHMIGTLQYSILYLNVMHGSISTSSSNPTDTFTLHKTYETNERFNHRALPTHDYTIHPHTKMEDIYQWILAHHPHDSTLGYPNTNKQHQASIKCRLLNSAPIAPQHKNHESCLSVSIQQPNTKIQSFHIRHGKQLIHQPIHTSSISLLTIGSGNAIYFTPGTPQDAQKIIRQLLEQTYDELCHQQYEPNQSQHAYVEQIRYIKSLIAQDHPRIVQAIQESWTLFTRDYTFDHQL